MPLIGKPETGLVIGIPTLGRSVSLEWATAFKGLNPPMNFKSLIAQIYGAHVADARNAIVRSAIENNSKYLFFLSDDVIAPPHALRQLIYRMEHDDNLGVVGGVYCSKTSPPFPLVFNGNGIGSYWDWKVGDYFPVTGLGMDCTLIRVECLKDFLDFNDECERDDVNSYKWFETIDDDEFLDGINKADQWTEDLRFLDKLKDTKWKIMCDSMVMCTHYNVATGDKFTLPKDSKPTQLGKIKQKTKVILDLGCGTFSPEALSEEGQVIRIDARKEVNPDYCCDIRQLPFESNFADIVYSSHVLEHFTRADCSDILEEFLRVLKPGGELRIVVPNLGWAIKEIEKDPEWFNSVNQNHILNVIYGAQTNPLDRHFNGFTPGRIEAIFLNLNLKNIKVTTDEGYNIFSVGTKTSFSEPIFSRVKKETMTIGIGKISTQSPGKVKPRSKPKKFKKKIKK